MRGRITALVAAVAAAAGTASAVRWARGRKDAELELEVSETPKPPSARPASTAPAAPAAAPTPPTAAPVAPSADEPAAAPTPEPVPVPPAGTLDDLTAIKGLGKVKAAKLVAVGVTSYAQVAAWTDDDIAEMGLKCNTSPGQIKREDWVGQARALTEG